MLGLYPCILGWSTPHMHIDSNVKILMMEQEGLVRALLRCGFTPGICSFLSTVSRLGGVCCFYGRDCCILLSVALPTC